ncbi:Hypothetical predicted protein [Mytilus galloprovincialis]|uniref:DZIP3-like HEPN domain-containing protein n=1 Tax=Mytilus galloprovincialis TaxID=29158 RepID=A0A8B6BZP9_MYTGA|nr:Hypothetical predicted protein [Mytilus galloprovincialis]
MPLSITTSSDYLSLECNRYLSILYKIIGDDLTELVRELLQHSITDSQVEDFYNAVRGQFKYRFTQREEQLIISAAGTGYQHLDITFLLKLLRHCPRNYFIEKQIASLTSIRNELAHLPNTEITQSQFDSYFEKCCDIASALEIYLNRPKSLVQKFQRIYEVNTSSKEGRIDLQVERIKYSLAELKSSEDIINNSEFNKRLEFLEECICQIDRQTDERHRQVIYLKKCAQQVKKKMDSPEQAQCFLTAQGTKPCIDSESLKYRQEEYNNKTRRDPVLDKTNVLLKKVEEESCEGQTTFKHTPPSYRLQPHLESLKACEDFGIRKCNERNSSVIGTFEHPLAFPTIKSKSMDWISLNRLDPSVVYLRSATNDRCKLAHSSSSYVGITENNSILVSQSPSVDTVSQISVKERGANLSQRKSEDGTLLSTNKKEDHRIRQLTNPQIKEGDSLAKPHTHEGKKLPTIMNKNHNEYFSKPATERKITVAPEQRKAQLPSRYFIPFTKTVAYSKSAVVFPKNIKNQFLTRQLSKLHSCKTTNEISMMAKRLSGFPLNDKKLFEAVCLLMRNRYGTFFLEKLQLYFASLKICFKLS